MMHQARTLSCHVKRRSDAYDKYLEAQRTGVNVRKALDDLLSADADYHAAERKKVDNGNP